LCLCCLLRPRLHRDTLQQKDEVLKAMPLHFAVEHNHVATVKVCHPSCNSKQVRNGELLDGVANAPCTHSGFWRTRWTRILATPTWSRRCTSRQVCCDRI
jgi:hypothetical protein